MLFLTASLPAPSPSAILRVRVRVGFLTLLVGFLAVARPARAAEPVGPVGPAAMGLRAGDWLVRGRIGGTIPTQESSRIGLIGGRIEVPALVLPDFDVSYFLTDHLSLEVQAGPARTRPVIRNSRVGDLAIGSIWTATAVGILQYRFLPRARLNPYLGVGLLGTTPLSVAPAPGIADFTVKSQVAPLIQAGIDYHLTGNWFGNAVVKYVFLPRQSYNLGGAAVEARMNMLMVGAGLGYRY